METTVVRLDQYKALSQAAREGRMDVLTSLISRGLDPNRLSVGTGKGYHPPLYWACRYGHLQVVQLLIEQYQCNPMYVTDRGTSLLHVACTMGYLDIARYLVKEHRLDPNARNKEGVTMLYSACYNGHLPVMKFLIGEMRCDAKSACVTCSTHKNEFAKNDRDGGVTADEQGLLYTACSRGFLDVVMYLVHEQGFDPYEASKFGVTPLHVACSNGHVEVVRYLVEKQRCNVACTDGNGCTPLHVACECSGSAASEVVSFLVAQDECDPGAKDNCGSTPLHVACRYGRLEVVKVLLSTGKVNPSCTTEDGEAPIEIAKSKEIINELIRGGANTTNLKLDHLRVEEHLESMVRVFVVGHPSSGKTTLVHALHPEHCKPTKRVFVKHYKKVPQVTPHTAGIIPYEFESGKFGRVLMFDFAGQSEYYASHAALLECSNTSSAPLFVLVVNLTESESTIQRRICYWLSFIESHRISTSSPPHIIIVGSHKDVLKHQNPSGYRSKILAIESFAKNQVSSTTKLHMIGFFATNCRLPKKQAKLRVGLQQSCTRLRSDVEVDILCHHLGLLILDKFQGRMTCTVEEIITEATASQTPIPLQAERLSELCKALSDRMSMLFLRNPLDLAKSWVVLDIKTLLSTINGRLFAPQDFKEHCVKASTTGVLSSTHLQQNFNDQQLDASLVMAFLSRLEFCHEVSDDETLRLIRDGNSSSSLSSWQSVSSMRPLLSRSGSDADELDVDGGGRRRLGPQLSYASIGSSQEGSLQTQLSWVDNVNSPPEIALSHYHFPQSACLPPRSYSPLGGYMDPTAITQPVPIAVPMAHPMYQHYQNNGLGPEYTHQGSGPLPPYGSPNGYYQNGYLPRSYSPQGYGPTPMPFPSHPCDPANLLPESSYPPSPHDLHRVMRSHSPLFASAPAVPLSLGPEKYLFFPAFIRSERPQSGIWMSDSSFDFYTGWCLSCTRQNQFFTPRLLHILLLRLSFGFAVAKSSSGKNGFDRECTIWRNGLRWLDLDGIETIVEMIEESKHIVMTMRGQVGSELGCVRLRSAVIRKILEAKEEFCSRVLTREYLIEPSQLRQTYAIVRSISEFTLYDMSVIVQAIVEEKSHVFCSHQRKLQKLDDLLYFEPYMGLGEMLLAQVYESSQQRDEDVQSLFFEFSAINCNRVMEITQVFGVSRSPNRSPNRSPRSSVVSLRPSTYQHPRIPASHLHCQHVPSPPQPENIPPPGDLCMQIIVKWWERSPSLTLQDFCKALDKYSVFAGRNILELFHCPNGVVYTSSLTL